MMEATKEIRTGFFTMDVIRRVCEQRSIEAAKQVAIDTIEAYDGVKPDNITKAMNMVARAKDIKSLAISMTNFMFAHPSENLKTIR